MLKLLFALGVSAAAVTSAHAACVAPNLQSSPAAIDQFVANPAGVLGSYPGGEGGLTSQVRNLVASDGRALSGVSSIASTANAAQRSALGAALGQAAIICRRPDPETLRRIQELVVQLNLPELTLAYSATTGDTRTTAVGGGGGAGGGAGGGGGTGTGATGATGGSGGIAAAFTGPVANSNFAFSAGTGLAAGTTTTVATGAGATSVAGVGTDTVSPTVPQ